MQSQSNLTLPQKICEQLQVRNGNRLYCIVDACQDRDFVFLAKSRYSQPIRSLFKGCGAVGMEDYAPYLIPIDPETDFIEQFCARTEENIGIFVTSTAKPVVIFRHLREIFVVQDEGGQEYFFRFYDPRVLRRYWETCEPAEQKELLGPLSGFAIPDRHLGLITLPTVTFD
jgi:hypothetical protein